jgi:hypothetical protein
MLQILKDKENFNKKAIPSKTGWLRYKNLTD